MVPVISTGLMDIEPGLVFWTLVTFGLLFFLLRWKAWGPLLHMVAERERKLRDTIDSAKRDHEAAQALLEEHRKLVGDARRAGAEAVRQALADAEVARQELLQKSRTEATELLAQARRQIDDQVKRAKAELSGMVVDLAMDAAEKVLGEALSDPQRQRQLVEAYVQSFSQPQ